MTRVVLIAAFIFVAAAGAWVFQNREKLAAACLATIDGVTARVAALDEPFGSGTVVASRNPIVGIVPDFELTGIDGKAVTKADLLGNFWIASFIFTRCATSCPMAVTELAGLQDSFPEEVKLVSFTVDPNHDSPEVLADYAKEVGADVERWWFLTGDVDLMYEYIRTGFYLAVEQNDGKETGWEVSHSPRFALVDPKGRIRGYYTSSDPEDLVRLREDFNRLSGREEEEG